MDPVLKMACPRCSVEVSHFRVIELRQGVAVCECPACGRQHGRRTTLRQKTSTTPALHLVEVVAVPTETAAVEPAPSYGSRWRADRQRHTTEAGR